MEKILSVLENIKGYLPLIRLADLLDVAIVAYLVYKLLSLVKSTRAANILKGVAIFLAALWLSSKLNLRVVNYILSHMVEWGVLALIIVFQPEIRRILEQLGSKNIRLLRTLAPEKELPELERAIDQTVLACTEMSRTRTGVLIVFERKILLDDVVRSGTTLDASVSSELLKNIFFVKAPMHDGAVIIRNGRILGAGCMLPLSKNVNLSRDLGMRHRAELGGQIGDMQSELTELRSEYDYLNNQLEMQTNLTEVENYARTELGLVKMDKSQITYVAGNEEARVVRQASGFQQFLQHITGGFLSFMSYLDP